MLFDYLIEYQSKVDGTKSVRNADDMYWPSFGDRGYSVHDTTVVCWDCCWSYLFSDRDVQPKQASSSVKLVEEHQRCSVLLVSRIRSSEILSKQGTHCWSIFTIRAYKLTLNRCSLKTAIYKCGDS